MSNFQKLAKSAIAVSPGTQLYLTPTGCKAIVRDINIANTTTGSLDCDIYLVDSGGSASASNSLFPTVTVPANTLVQWTGNLVLTEGDFIQGIGSAAGLTVTIAGERESISR